MNDIVLAATSTHRSTGTKPQDWYVTFSTGVQLVGEIIDISAGCYALKTDAQRIYFHHAHVVFLIPK